MHKITSKLIAGVMALAMASVSTVSAAPAKQDRKVMLIGESTFEKKSLPWRTYAAYPAKQAFDLDDGAFHITIYMPQGADHEKWDLQFKHKNLNFKAGHEYRVSFKAKSNRNGLELCSQIGDSRNGNVYFTLDGQTKDMHMGPHMGGKWAGAAVKLSNEWQTFEGIFKPTEDLEGVEWAFDYAQGTHYQGNASSGDEIWFDDIVVECLTCEESDDPVCEWRCPEGLGYVIPRSDVRLNQVGYYPDSVKVATYETDSDKEAMDFRVLNEKGEEVYKGRTKPVGMDDEAGLGYFHKLDFSAVKKPGRYTIVIDDEGNVYTDPYTGEVYKQYISHEFTVGDKIYSDIFRDAMNFFYLQHSDIDLDEKKIVSEPSEENRAKLAHEAFHAKDEAYVSSDWNVITEKKIFKDAAGGWYTDDNCSKNVIAGANAVWLLQNMYELSYKNGYKAANGNLADILDEARYELEFMLNMVVDPEKDSIWGEDFADMVYHGVRYTNSYNPVDLGLITDKEKLKRVVNPPTYAATFDMIACAAQAARLWEKKDPDFAAECLKQAEASWNAVKRHEKEWTNRSIRDKNFASHLGIDCFDFYDHDLGDFNLSDEAYWAACELFATTGDKEYYDYLTSFNSDLSLTECIPDSCDVIFMPYPEDSFKAFCETNTYDFGTLSLYLSDKISEQDRKLINVNIGKAADNFMAAAANDVKDNIYANAMDTPYRKVSCGFGLDEYTYPADRWDTYEFGSNSSIVNNAVIMAYAYEATGDVKYKEYAGYALDYIFGRNGLGISYVTGYGTYHTNKPSSSFWLNEVDSRFPTAPNGIMVGGPTGLAGSPDGISDSFVKAIGLKIGEVPDQQLYADSAEAWTCNSVTPQWQAALAWMLSFFENNMGNDDEVPMTTTTAASTTTTITTTTTSEFNVILVGDTNCDGQVNMADAVLIMQALANPNKYGLNGTAGNHLTEQGKLNGDMNGDGLTVGDAQSIQRKLLGLDNGEITDSDRSAIAGKTFSYEKGGCGGEFTITFDEHGRFACHEKDILSYMTEGTWELNGDTVKLAYPVDESTEKAVYLKLKGSDLVYIGEKSDNFTDVKVQDGEKFTDTKIRNKVDWYDDYMISLKKDTDWSKNNKNLSAVIKDTDGLKSYLEQFCNEKAMSFYLDKYDDSFFKDNVLFMKWIFQGSGSAGPAYMVNVTMQPDNGLCMFVMYNGLLNGDSMASVCLAQVTVPKGIYDDNKEYNWNWVGYNVML